jgi:hypothetical protein
MQTDPAWHDNLIFGEYFHGDNGAALGAFHQTGWARPCRRCDNAPPRRGPVNRRSPERPEQKGRAVTSQRFALQVKHRSKVP